MKTDIQNKYYDLSNYLQMINHLKNVKLLTFM